jgi:hypothetical protein
VVFIDGHSGAVNGVVLNDTKGHEPAVLTPQTNGEAKGTNHDTKPSPGKNGDTVVEVDAIGKPVKQAGSLAGQPGFNGHEKAVNGEPAGVKDRPDDVVHK